MTAAGARRVAWVMATWMTIPGSVRLEVPLNQERKGAEIAAATAVMRGTHEENGANVDETSVGYG